MTTTSRRIADLPVHEQIACAILGYHETGKWERHYGKVAFSHNDPGGLSVGWGQAAFQTRSQFLGNMLQRYVDDPLAQHASALKPWLEQLNLYWSGSQRGVKRSRVAQADPQLHALLRLMADDPVWQGIQDTRFLRELDRAREIWKKRKWESHLALLAIFDQVIQGPQWFMESRVDTILTKGGHEEYKAVVRRGASDFYSGHTWEGFGEEDEEGARWPDIEDEYDYLYAWYLLRLDYLMTEGYNEQTKISWPRSSYRCAHLLWMMDNDVWDFEWGVEIQTYHPQNQTWTITPELLAGE